MQHLIVLPIFPQYSGTTTASVFDAVASRSQKTRSLPELRFITQYVDEPQYVEALADRLNLEYVARPCATNPAIASLIESAPGHTLAARPDWQPPVFPG